MKELRACRHPDPFQWNFLHAHTNAARALQDHWCSEPHTEDKITFCEQCQVPVCADCCRDLKEAKLPPSSYANDMWTGYGLDRIYEENVTVIELACASPCLTSLICMSMESKHRQEPNNAAFDEQAHMARHRYGARGNVISFPLPVEALLQQLAEHTAAPDSTGEIVPRTGLQLGEIFRVILKTNKKGKTTDEEIKTLIHQATVRRQARSRKQGSCKSHRIYNIICTYINCKYDSVSLHMYLFTDHKMLWK